MILNYIVQMLTIDGDWEDIAGFGYRGIAKDYQNIIELEIPEREFRIVKRTPDGLDVTPGIGRIIH
jgi:hypothetical protein